MNLNTYYFAECVGARVARIGTTVGPDASGIIAQLPAGEIRFVSPAQAQVLLPAYWNDGMGPVSLGAPPSPSHAFDYDTLRWVLDDDAAWAAVRREREQRFAETAWIRERASDMGAPVPQTWLDYWQALRDITLQPDPTAIKWPEPPQT